MACADRADGVLLLDLSLERERATIGRFFGQSYLSMNALGYFLMALLLFGAFSLRYYLRTLIQTAGGRAARHDHQRPARRPAQPPQSVAVAAGDVRGDLRRRHRQHARLRDRHRLPARRRARAVFEPALAHHADRHDQRAADADRTDPVALRRQLVVVPGEPFGRGVRDLRDRLLRLRQHAQVAGRSAGARRSSALARRDRRACARRWSAPKPPKPTNRRMVERIRMANDAAGLSVWEWDIKEDITRIDENSPFIERLGAPREFKGTDYTQKYVHPDDREGWVAHFTKVLTSNDQLFSYRYRALFKSTAPSAHIQCHARVLRDAKGHPVQRARHRLGRHRRRAGEARDRAPVRPTCAKRRSVSSAPCPARRTRCSSSICARARPGTRRASARCSATAATDNDADGKIETFIHPDDGAIVGKAMGDHLTFGLPYDIEYRLRKNDGDWLWVRSRASAERDTEDRPLWLAGSIHDITDERAGARGDGDARRRKRKRRAAPRARSSRT